jgi:hypothetical protein
MEILHKMEFGQSHYKDILKRIISKFILMFL